MKFVSYGLTNVGMKRDNNEDSYVIVDNELFCVADGMGGYEFGEKASNTAVTLIKDLFGLNRDKLSHDTVIDLLVSWVKEINTQIYKENEKLSAHMGTTIATAVSIEDRLYLANVGDSRIYRISPRIITEQITDDHSLVAEQVRLGIITEEEARNHPRKNIITRALGIFPEINVDTFSCIPRQDDYYLICSDGLTNMVDDETLAAITLDDQASLEEKAERLVKTANEAGGTDNITLILIEVNNE